MAEPTRRHILRSTPAVLGALAGCEALGDLGRDQPDDDAARMPTTNESVSQSAPGRELELRNTTDDDLFVSFAISDGDVVVASTTVELPAQTSRRYTLQAPTGVLSVELETTTGRTATHQWVVGEHANTPTITIESNDVTFSQHVWCTPTCRPLSRDGSASAFNVPGVPAVKGSFRGALIVLTNTTSRSFDVSLSLTRDGKRVLDFTYYVPSGVTLQLPGVHHDGVYGLSIDADIGTLSYDWRPGKEQSLTVRLTSDGVFGTCGQSTALFVLQNADDTVHQLDVTAQRPDADLPVFDNRYIVQPGANYLVSDVYTGSGHYLLRVATDENESTTYDWWLCPPRGPTVISVLKDGGLRVFQSDFGDGSSVIDGGNTTLDCERQKTGTRCHD